MGIPNKKVGEFRFYFKTESVIVAYQDRTYISFHSYNERNKKNLVNFGEACRKSRSMSIDKVYSLAREYNVPAVGTSEASVRPIQTRILW